MARTATTKPKRPSSSKGAAKGSGGAGWGGPAKGAGSKRAKAPAIRTPKNNRGKKYDLTASEKAAQVKEMLFSLATNKRQEGMTRIRAGEAWLNRHEGMPVARNVNINVDDISQLSDEALEQRRKELEAEITLSDGTACAAIGGTDQARETP